MKEVSAKMFNVKCLGGGWRWRRYLWTWTWTSWILGQVPPSGPATPLTCTPGQLCKPGRAAGGRSQSLPQPARRGQCWLQERFCHQVKTLDKEDDIKAILNCIWCYKVYCFACKFFNHAPLTVLFEFRKCLVDANGFFVFRQCCVAVIGVVCVLEVLCWC